MSAARPTGYLETALAFFEHPLSKIVRKNCIVDIELPHSAPAKRFLEEVVDACPELDGFALLRDPRGVLASGAIKHGNYRAWVQSTCDLAEEQPHTPAPELHRWLHYSMAPKKAHEIDNMAQLLGDLCDAVGCRTVVDFGAGQGGLGRVLAIRHDLHVIGIESNKHNCDVAERRYEENLAHLRRHLRRTPGDAPRLVRHPEDPSRVGRYTAVHSYFDQPLSASQLLELLEPHVPAGERFVLTGLHACGDLGPHILRVFAAEELRRRAAGLALVGCCYHLLTEPHAPEEALRCVESMKRKAGADEGGAGEESKRDDSGESAKPSAAAGTQSPAVFGHPMSERVRFLGERATLGYGTRMLATQCFAREMWRTAESFAGMQRAVTFRVILQRLLLDNFPALRVGGKLDENVRVGPAPDRASKSFDDYVDWVFSMRLKDQARPSSEVVNAALASYDLGRLVRAALHPTRPLHPPSRPPTRQRPTACFTPFACGWGRWWWCNM